MELETMHDREFYEAMAKEHPILEQVIAGETTLKECLDEILAEMDKTTSIRAAIDITLGRSEVRNHFPGYLNLITGLVWDQLDQEIKSESLFAVEKYASWVGGDTYKKILRGAGGGLTTAGGLGIAAIILGITSLPLLIAFTLGASGCAFTTSAGAALSDFLTQKVKKKCYNVLGPIYNAAEVLDTDIGCCFILEHFNSARPRFEQTYIALGQEEQAQFDTQLYGMLGAGGMKGMDEIQLNDYLSGLQKPKGDA